MRDAGGLRGRRLRWLFGFALAASIASACAEEAKPRAEMSGVAGGPATSGVVGQPAGAGAAGNPGVNVGMQATGGLGGSVPPQVTPMGGVGGASSSVDASTQAGSAAPADAGVDAGPGTAGSGESDAGSTMTDAGITSVCAGGTVGKDSEAAPAAPLTVSREYAGVKYLTPAPNQILSLKTTMKVPKTPSSRQTLFIWPGLQSKGGSADPARIGNGVLQPVLTWGSSCAPRRPGDPYAAWWISGMYVNVTTDAAGPSGCAGGDFLSTELGDLIAMDMSVKGTDWTQTMTDLRTMKTVDFTIDLEGQVQNNAMWIVEVPSGLTVRPAEDVVFTQSVLTFSSPVTTCQPNQAGKTDYFSAPVLSRDGLHCCYDEIILRAQR